MGDEEKKVGEDIPKKVEGFLVDIMKIVKALYDALKAMITAVKLVGPLVVNIFNRVFKKKAE